MNRRVLVSMAVIALALGALIYTAVNATAKEVVTVEILLEESLVPTRQDQRSVRRSIRLGARVVEGNIEYETSPGFLLKFHVRGIADETKRLPVIYRGIMPDTLKPGRDVILEGDYVEGSFIATSLMTQCPSKYEPPVVGEARS